MQNSDNVEVEKLLPRWVQEFSPRIMSCEETLVPLDTSWQLYSPARAVVMGLFMMRSQFPLDELDTLYWGLPPITVQPDTCTSGAPLPLHVHEIWVLAMLELQFSTIWAPPATAAVFWGKTVSADSLIPTSRIIHNENVYNHSSSTTHPNKQKSHIHDYSIK